MSNAPIRKADLSPAMTDPTLNPLLIERPDLVDPMAGKVDLPGLEAYAKDKGMKAFFASPKPDRDAFWPWNRSDAQIVSERVLP